MARSKRRLISQDEGSYHIMSRVAGGQLLFNGEDKKHFFTLLERFAMGFFVEIHAFVVMGNHFHIEVTCLEKEVRLASKEELFERYRHMYPKTGGPPDGSQVDGVFIPDGDGGEGRLRRRLGSISCFVKELKQEFSRWYNKKYHRKGYLWGDRFKGVILSKGEAQLVCSAYIDLNPVRAKIVKKPEDYEFSSLSLRVNAPARSHQLLRPLSILPCFSGWDFSGEEFDPDVEPPFGPIVLNEDSSDQVATYREFVYQSGGLGQIDRFYIWPEILGEVNEFHRKFGIKDRLRSRVKNFSEGLALGNYGLIAGMQKSMHRKKIRPRSIMGRDRNCGWSFSTRVLRL